MHINFAGVDEQFIKAEVKEGYYTSETELVRDAVRRLREEKEKTRHFHKAVMQGVEQIEQGNTVSYTPELLEDIKKRATKKIENNEPYNSPDALPKHH